MCAIQLELGGVGGGGGGGWSGTYNFEENPGSFIADFQSAVPKFVVNIPNYVSKYWAWNLQSQFPKFLLKYRSTEHKRV